MIHIFKRNKQNIYAAASGESFPIEEVKDEVFSQKMVGDGIAIHPSDGCIVAPCSGKLTVLFPTGHAFGITREDGVELLVHIGIDSVSLKGKGFTAVKAQNDVIHAGERIVQVDLDYLNTKQIDPTVLILFTNLKELRITKTKDIVVQKGKTVIAKLY